MRGLRGDGERRCIAIAPGGGGCALDRLHVARKTPEGELKVPHVTAWGLTWLDAPGVEYVEIGALDDADGESLRAWLTEEHREITGTVERPGSIIARTEVVDG